LLVKRVVLSGLLRCFRKINAVDIRAYLSLRRYSRKYTLNLETMADTEKHDM